MSGTHGMVTPWRSLIKSQTNTLHCHLITLITHFVSNVIVSVLWKRVARLATLLIVQVANPPGYYICVATFTPLLIKAISLSNTSIEFLFTSIRFYFTSLAEFLTAKLCCTAHWRTAKCGVLCTLIHLADSLLWRSVQHICVAIVSVIACSQLNFPARKTVWNLHLALWFARMIHCSL